MCRENLLRRTFLAPFVAPHFKFQHVRIHSIQYPTNTLLLAAISLLRYNWTAEMSNVLFYKENDSLRPWYLISTKLDRTNCSPILFCGLSTEFFLADSSFIDHGTMKEESWSCQPSLEKLQVKVLRVSPQKQSSELGETSRHLRQNVNAVDVPAKIKKKRRGRKKSPYVRKLWIHDEMKHQSYVLKALCN